MSEALARYRVTGRLATGGNAQVDVWEPTIEKMRQDIDSGVYGDGAIRDLAETACAEGETYLAEGRSLDEGQATLKGLLKLVQEFQARRDATHTRFVEALAQFDAARQAEELER